jgi:hypothetical protein
VPVPEELFVSNITHAPSSGRHRAPTGFIHPVIDGEVTNYFEWIGPARSDIVPLGDAMHEVSGAQPASEVEFGFDSRHLYVKVAGSMPMRDAIAAISSERQFSQARGLPDRHQRGCGTVRASMTERPRGGATRRSCPDINVAAGVCSNCRCRFGV